MFLKRLTSGYISRWIVLFGSIIVAAALAFFAHIGSYSRFWADDYCYSALIKQYGWLRGIEMWYLTSGNRFSTIATVGWIDVFGPRVISFLPTTLLIFWVLAWFIFLEGVNRLFSWNVNRLWLAFISLLQVYFATLLSPDRLQAIYWRMGSLHYTFPMPFLLLQLGLTAFYYKSASERKVNFRGSLWVLALSGVAAFYIGGQSEPPAFTQAGVYALISIVSLFLLKGRRRTLALQLSIAPLVGTLFAIVVLFISPYNANRLHYMPAPDNLLLILPYSIRYVFEFFYYSVRGQIIPYLVLTVGSLAISLLILVQSNVKLSWRSIGIGLFFSFSLTIFFAVLSFAPSAYANLQYPGPRALMPGCFLLIAGIGVSSFFIAAAGRRLLVNLPAAWLQAVALGLVLLTSFYPIHAARGLMPERQMLSTWAARWDARDQQIRQAIAVGNYDVEVKQIEVVRTLEDIGPEPNYWLNACATVFYGARSIVANP